MRKTRCCGMKGNTVIEPVSTLESPAQALRFYSHFSSSEKQGCQEHALSRLLFYFPRVTSSILRNWSPQTCTGQREA